MSLVKKILNHSFWLLVGNSIGRLAMFVTNIVAARMLSQEVFGQFMMVRSTVSMIEGIISGSLGSPIIKNIAETNHTNNQKLSTIITTIFIINLLFVLIISITMFIMTETIVHIFFMGNTQLVVGFYIGSIIVASSIMSLMIQNIMIGFEQYKKLALAALTASIISIPLILILIKYYNFIGALLGVALYFSMDFILKFIQFRTVYLNKIFKINFKLIMHENKKLIISSTPLFLSILSTNIAFWYARVFYINTAQSFKGIAVFDAAFQWLTIIMIITGATTSVVLPKLSKLNKDNNKADQKHMFQVNLIINFSISIIISLIFVIFAKNIISLYGDAYINGYTVLQILAFTAILFTIASIFNKYMVANNKFHIILLSTIIGICSMYIFLLTASNNINNLAISFCIFYGAMSIAYIIGYFKVELKNI